MLFAKTKVSSIILALFLCSILVECNPTIGQNGNGPTKSTTTDTELDSLANFLSKMVQNENANLLRNIQNSMTSNQLEIRAEIDGLKKTMAKMQKQIDAISSNHSTVQAETKLFHQPKNNWNPEDCHADLLLNETSKLIQLRNNTANTGFSSCRAKVAVSFYDEKFYFEVKIINGTRRSNIGIGLAPKEMPLDKAYWRYKGVYVYSSGRFWGHSVEGSKSWFDNGNSYIEEKPKFGVGYVIGCGMNLKTRQIIYTKNGQRLDTINLIVDSEKEFYPFVSIYFAGDAVKANFGPNFLYNPFKENEEIGKEL